MPKYTEELIGQFEAAIIGEAPAFQAVMIEMVQYMKDYNNWLKHHPLSVDVLLGHESDQEEEEEEANEIANPENVPSGPTSPQIRKNDDFNATLKRLAMVAKVWEMQEISQVEEVVGDEEENKTVIEIPSKKKGVKRPLASVNEEKVPAKKQRNL